MLPVDRSSPLHRAVETSYSAPRHLQAKKKASVLTCPHCRHSLARSGLIPPLTAPIALSHPDACPAPDAYENTPSNGALQQHPLLQLQEQSSELGIALAPQSLAWRPLPLPWCEMLNYLTATPTLNIKSLQNTQWCFCNQILFSSQETIPFKLHTSRFLLHADFEKSFPNFGKNSSS